MQSNDSNPSRIKKEYSAQEIFETVSDTVVHIQTDDGHGSGVIIDFNGFIATNHHVVGDSHQVCVRLKNGSEFSGDVVRSYRDVDLAFVRINIGNSPSFISSLISSRPGQGLLCNRKFKVGEAVFAIGHPHGLDFTLTQGIVSSAERSINGAKYVQIDAAINPGNSGGALYSIYAELLGINTMGLRGTQGLNFAIPAQEISSRYTSFLDEQRTKMNNYCTICGYSSFSNKYCEQCGASIVLTKPSLTTMKVQEAQQKESSTESVCLCCGQIAKEDEKYCQSCGSFLNA